MVRAAPPPDDVLLSPLRDARVTAIELRDARAEDLLARSRFAAEVLTRARKQADRRLFPFVERIEAPESAGHTVDGSVASIKKNIQYLHELLLDEKLDAADPEIERTYQLFLDTWHELSMDGNPDLTWDCSGRWDPSTGKDLPDEVQVKDDKDYTVRAWMAVVSYLLSDWKFLYE